MTEVTEIQGIHDFLFVSEEKHPAFLSHGWLYYRNFRSIKTKLLVVVKSKPHPAHAKTDMTSASRNV